MHTTQYKVSSLSISIVGPQIYTKKLSLKDIASLLHPVGSSGNSDWLINHFVMVVVKNVLKIMLRIENSD